MTVNKKMKEYVNFFYSILDQLETRNFAKKENLIDFFQNLLNNNKNNDFYADYYVKFEKYLSKNTLNHFSKDIINANF